MNMVTLFFVIVLTIVFATLLAFKWRFSYWIRKKVYTIKPEIPFGNLKNSILKKNNVGIEISDHYNFLRSKGLKFGGLFLFTRPLFLIADLDLLKNILIKDFQYFTDRAGHINEKSTPLSANLLNLKGSKWKTMRNRLSPSFTISKLKTMFNMVNDCSGHVLKTLEEAAHNSQAVDINELFLRYTTDVIRMVAFGYDIKFLKDTETEFLTYGNLFFETGLLRNIIDFVSLAVPQILDAFNISFMDKNIEEFFIGVVKNIMDHRIKNKIDRDDFFKVLLQLRSENIFSKDFHVNDDGNRNGVPFYQDGLTLNEIAAQVFAIFEAGFGTTSTTLVSFLYEIVLNPDVQVKLREEIITVLEQYDGNITYDAIMNMEYLDKCFQESLRKHPPTPIVGRECTKTYKIPNSDIELSKGDLAVISVFGIHRDPEFFPEPEKFDPERFSSKNKSKIRPMSFIPFGEGPRMCFGVKLATIEVKLIIATIFKNFKLTMSRKTKLPLEYTCNALVFAIKDPVLVNVERA